MILSDLERLSKIFTNTKRRVVSVRQLSSLLSVASDPTLGRVRMRRRKINTASDRNVDRGTCSESGRCRSSQRKGEAGTARTENLIATWRRLVAMDYIESERVDKAVTEPGRRLHQE